MEWSQNYIVQYRPRNSLGRKYQNIKVGLQHEH